MARALRVLWMALYLAQEARRRTTRSTDLSVLRSPPGLEGRTLVRKGEAMRTYRCKICSTNWPHRSEYKECLNCLAACSPMSTVPKDDILTEDEALSLKRHIEFEEFCEKRDRELVNADLAKLQALGPAVLLVDDVIGP